MKLVAERDDPLLQLNDFKVWIGNLEKKVSEEEIIVKAMIESVKYLETKERSLQYGTILPLRII